MKLGILALYYLPPGNDWIRAKHLQRLAATIPVMDFKVYTVEHRLPPETRDLLRAHKFVEIVPLPPVPATESAEHGTYLNLLAKHAVADGCDYICTFDTDSWPIRPDWIKLAHEMVAEQEAVCAAILRAENGDTVLPYPAFIFAEARLFLDDDCCYWIDERDRTKEFRDFLAANHQFGDTGSPLGYFFETRKLPWIKLLRTNKKDVHYLMAGIYGDLVFHLGASGREDRVFRGDYAGWAMPIRRALNSLPVLWRLERPIMGPLLRRNRRIFDTIARRLTTDDEAFYQELRGDAAGAPAPNSAPKYG